MKSISRIIMVSAAVLGLASCGQNKGDKDFKYLIDEFADLKVMRYQVPGWDELSLQQKEYIYHLAEAAKWGRDIYWDQNCAWNIPVRKAVENIIDNYSGNRKGQEFADFMVYAKRLFFSNGFHHHYAEDKFVPACSREYFASLMESVGVENSAELLNVIYNPELYPSRKAISGDIVAESAVNFYEGVTREEAEAYYNSIVDEKDPTPISYGLNTKLVKGADGVIREEAWKVGGIYGAAIEKIVEELELAAPLAETDAQRDYIASLVAYYRTGDLRLWDEYNIKWLKDTLGTVDFVNGFVEDYNDPLGRKGSWEALVNIKDHAASARTETLSANAQWFEDNSPVDPSFKKPVVKGVSAKVINVVALAGDSYPATPIGINLPNADWIRREHGSKSVTISNITDAYSKAAEESPKSTLTEFAYDEEEIAMAKKYLSITDNVHTDLHECLGHGSGQLLPGVSPNALAEYSSTLEEARADLYGLYYMADPKLVELGILPDEEAYKAQYANYIRNGLMVQFSRVELGKPNTEAHMQNRKLIAEWCLEHGTEMHYCDDEGCRFINAIEKQVKDGKTYFVVNEYGALRELFGELLAEIQRIKSEGDYEAGKALVEQYAVNIDRDLHREVLERYAELQLKPYGGFVNPDIVPVEENGKIVDYKLDYTASYVDQMMNYGHNYSIL
ncbi:MAG: dipeptidyl peptidase 3 [Bacteroidales bacterium]|nr:dipeptidyl peptidase 3 [Bacteroidales bacterium]